jgi:hypothetical protein
MGSAKTASSFSYSPSVSLTSLAGHVDLEVPDETQKVGPLKAESVCRARAVAAMGLERRLKELLLELLDFTVIDAKTGRVLQH